MFEGIQHGTGYEVNSLVTQTTLAVTTVLRQVSIYSLYPINWNLFISSQHEVFPNVIAALKGACVSRRGSLRTWGQGSIIYAG